MGTTYFSPIVLLTGILSLVQSVTWFILSLLGILAFRCQMTIPVVETSSDKFTALLYHLYFEGVGCEVDSPYITHIGRVNLRDAIYGSPSYINGFMAAYMAFNIVFFVTAMAFLFNRSKGPDSFPRKLLAMWCATNLGILIIDLWLTIVFGVDYQNVDDVVANSTSNSVANSMEWAPSVPGALMAIAAKGFILWIFNFVLFVYFIRFIAPWGYIFSCVERASESQNHQKYGGRANRGYEGYDASIPRVHYEHNNMALVPVSSANNNWSESRHPTRSHPNAVEGVTSFNDQYATPSRQKRSERWEDSERRHERPEDFDPPHPRQTVDGDRRPGPSHANVRSVFNGPDRRNFTRGPGEPNSRPYGMPANSRSNEYFY